MIRAVDGASAFVCAYRSKYFCHFEELLTILGTPSRNNQRRGRTAWCLMQIISNACRARTEYPSSCVTLWWCRVPGAGLVVPGAGCAFACAGCHKHVWWCWVPGALLVAPGAGCKCACVGVHRSKWQLPCRGPPYGPGYRNTHQLAAGERWTDCAVIVAARWPDV